MSATDEAGPPLYVFKGKKLPFREVLLHGRVQVQTYTQLLPRHACIAMREEGGRVDARNFLQWTHRFIESERDLTANGRHMLLT